MDEDLRISRKNLKSQLEKEEKKTDPVTGAQVTPSKYNGGGVKTRNQ